MKRKVLILFILFLLVSTKDLEASTYSNYLPAGKNYIEEANLIINNDTLSTIDDIYVKSNTTYTLSFIGEALIEYPEIHLSSRNNGLVVYKDQISKFETDNFDYSMQQISNFLSGNCSKDNYIEILIKRIDVIPIIKKIVEGKARTIDFNYFISMPIELHIIDTIWTSIASFSYNCYFIL